MRYSNGYIYKIFHHNNPLVYIGSTTKTINDRFEQHRISYNRYKSQKTGYVSSYKLFLTNSIPVIELLETLTNVTKQELLQRERTYIENNECINVNIPIRTYKEKLEYAQKYHKENFDVINNRKNEKVVCETCNCSVSRTNITHHYKSKKHKNNI